MESVNPKTPFGNSKPPLALIPSTALLQLSKVMELGAKKYGAYNWRTIPKIEAMVYINAALRHLHLHLDGETIDAESGQPHLAHVMACCAILLDAMAVGNLEDDRPPAAPFSEMLDALTIKA